jgi:hypothetical protein
MGTSLPDIRKQLQELLDKREERWIKRKKNVKEGFNSVKRELSSFLSSESRELTPEEAKKQNWLSAIIIIGAIVFYLLLFLFL